MKEDGVMRRRSKKIYSFSLVLFLISYLITLVNMIANTVTGSFHLYIFSTLSFMLPYYKFIETKNIFCLILTILMFAISFLLIFFTAKYDVLKYDKSKKPLYYMSLMLWLCVTQVLSLWLLANLYSKKYTYLTLINFYEREELQYIYSAVIFAIYQIIVALKRMYDSRDAFDAINISIVPPFEKYFSEKTIFCYTIPNCIFSGIAVLLIIYIGYIFESSFKINVLIVAFGMLMNLFLLFLTLFKYRQIIKYRGVEVAVRKNFKVAVYVQLGLLFAIACAYLIVLLTT